ncbi:MAG: hypothetical protein ABI609_03020 [Acidobacteriota bacterium]
MNGLGFVAVVLSAVALGTALTRRFAPGAPDSLSAGFAAGLIALHLVLQAMSILGLGWHWLVAPALGAIGWLWTLRSAPAPARERWALGWGDGAAFAACLLICGLAVAMAIDNPDFVFHWGLKARKFALAGGLDFRFLQAPSNWRVHPDYPNLLPELFAITSLGERSFHEPVLLAWSGLFFAAALLAAREALARLAADSLRRQAALAFIAFSVAGFVIATELTGNADALISWALLLALPALVEPAAPGAAFRLAIAAALAASSKIEGVPLAGFMLAGFLWALVSSRVLPRRALALRLAMVALPTALVVAPWLAINLRHSLFLTTNSGPFSLERLDRAMPFLARALGAHSWNGATAVVLLIPLLLWSRSLRPATTVCVAQLAFYLWVYSTSPVDTASYVQWSFPRLLLHVLPALWVLAAGWHGRSPKPLSSSITGDFADELPRLP